MLSLVFDFGIGIASTPDGTQQKITDKSVPAGGRNATSAYSWMNFDKPRVADAKLAE
ncbi:hypothetical protein [Burkholderia pyrrocinia]|uniref:hypothetical protein n=1 Tax=Burkholderia pyrrocinia TaxID=60550 RepID=UPI002AB2E471|nr:hypothetical protein [Burkholderia pyrrocinia]